MVTTPQEAAAEVAERAGTMASMMHQRVVGVVENMSFLPCPHCAAEGTEHRLEIFGTGGGDRVAATLSERFGYDVPVLGRIPLDISLREGGDAGKPIVDSDPTAPGAARAHRRRRQARRPRPRPRRHAARPHAHQQVLTSRFWTVFGVGLPELAVIAFVAVLVFGPDKLPDLARQAGQMVRKARDLANNARDELRAELGPEYADLELRDLDPRTIVRKHIVEAMEDADDERAAGRPGAASARSATASSRRTTPTRPEPARPLSRGSAPPRARRTAPARAPVLAHRRPRRSRRRPGAATPSWRRRRRRCSTHRSPASASRRSAEPRPSRATGDQATSGTERGRGAADQASTAASAHDPVLPGAADQAPAGADPLEHAGDRADARTSSATSLPTEAISRLARVTCWYSARLRSASSRSRSAS